MRNCASNFSHPGAPNLPDGSQSERPGHYGRPWNCSSCFLYQLKNFVARRPYDVFLVPRSGTLLESSLSQKPPGANLSFDCLGKSYREDVEAPYLDSFRAELSGVYY